MLFVAAGVTDTKVRHSTGVATTNSTNKNPNANKLIWAINFPDQDRDQDGLISYTEFCDRKTLSEKAFEVKL